MFLLAINFWHVFSWDNPQYRCVLSHLFEYDLFISQVKLWDAERRSCIGTGKGHLGAVGSVAFSKKSKNFFVSGSRFVVQFLWDICMPSQNCYSKNNTIFLLVIEPSRYGPGMIRLMMMKFLLKLRLL